MTSTESDVQRPSRRALLLGAGALLAGSTTAIAASDPVWPPKTWQSTLHRSHRLVGRIWSPTARRFLSFGALRQMTRDADILMVGEVHDNPDHHALQGELATGRTGMAVFEHLRADQSEALARWRERRSGDAAADVRSLFQAVDWSQSGWPDATMFEPVFRAVLAGGLDIMPGDLGRERVKTVSRQGETAVDLTDRARLGLDAALPPAVASGLLDELEASHCGLVPRASFGPMAFAQRLRDATLADAVLADGRRKAILLAGNGHVRADRGVPWYLERRAAERSRVSVLQLEVRRGVDDPSAYRQGTADAIVFTPGRSREDQCAAMRKAFQNKS